LNPWLGIYWLDSADSGRLADENNLTTNAWAALNRIAGQVTFANYKRDERAAA